MLKPKDLVTVYVANHAQRNACIILASQVARLPVGARLHILTASSDARDLRGILLALRLSAHVVPLTYAPEPGDPYHSKLLLRKIIRTRAWRNTRITYLDADHLLGATFRLPRLLEHSCRVSSEGVLRVRATASHYNTSLIDAHSALLARVTDGWETAYRNAMDHAPRHREELAFGFAAKRARVRLIPASPTFQSNWATWSHTFRMFHYGGPGAAANGVKGGPLRSTSLAELKHWLDDCRRLEFPASWVQGSIARELQLLDGRLPIGSW